MPELPDLCEGPSPPLFKHIHSGSTAARVFSSVILSSIKSKPALPTWCLSAISCALCESLISHDFSDFNGEFIESLQSHFKLNFADWNLCLPPSDARSVCIQKHHHATAYVGCGHDCRQDHATDGNCLVCGRDWGDHQNHNCLGGPSRRGSWRVSVSTPDSLFSESNCTCGTRKNPETGLNEFVFNLGESSVDFMTTGSAPFLNETEEQREFREFQEFQEFLRLKKLKFQTTSATSLAVKKVSERCPACFDKNFSLFGSPDSFGIFPGSTVTLKETGLSCHDQSALSRILKPGQTGFVICTYRSFAFVQGSAIAGIISCEMLQLVSCVASSLFFEAPSVRSISESTFFSDVMATVMKRVTTHFPPAQQKHVAIMSESLFDALFSSFGPDYNGPFVFPFREQSDFVFFCRSASLFSSSLTHVLKSRFNVVDDLIKLFRFLCAFGSVNWEEVLSSFNYIAYAHGIHGITRQIEDHFLSLLFTGNRDSSASSEFVMYKLISSLSSSEVTFLAHTLKHSTLSSNFFIPFLHYFASNIVSGHIAGIKSHLVFSFLQLCIPSGAFLQLRHALLQLSGCLPSQPHFRSSSKNLQVSKIQRWIVVLLLPQLGASCTAIIDGQIQSILPHCGWCEIVLPGLSAIRMAIPEGLVFDMIYSAKVPVSMADILAKFPLQDFFVVEATKSLLSKKLITKIGSACEGFVVPSHFLQLPTTAVSLPRPSFHSLGHRYCEAVHAIFSCFKSTPSIYEHELFHFLCREDIDGACTFSGSYIAFVLSKILATGKIVRNGPFLLKIGESLSSSHSSFEPREFQFSTSSCIRSMVVVVCDESSLLPSLSSFTAATCESFAPDLAQSLVAESFTRIHQDTGADFRDVSDCFTNCKGNLICTIYMLMFDPKFASKTKVEHASSMSPLACHTVGEGYCAICDEENKILVALPCKHRYCQECLQGYILTAMADSSTPKAAAAADRAGGRVVSNICCPSHSVNSGSCPYMLQTTDVKFLADKEYSSFVNLICRQSTRAMASGAFPTVTCFCGRLIVGQTSDCEYECSCGRISSIGDVKNSNALQNWMAHPFSSCLQEVRWKEYTQVGSEARQNLMRIKNCPSCGSKTTRCGCQGVAICNEMDKCPLEGCDHITCRVCSSHWCWVCGRLGSTESSCTYPKHLITQTKELFKEAEAKVQEMENEFFKHSWRAIRFDPIFNTASVLSVAQTPLSFSSLTKGDIIISINGERVTSSESAQKALSRGWAPGRLLRIQYQSSDLPKLLVCQVPSDSLLEQDAFPIQRSLIVRSVSDIASNAVPDSCLEKSRALLDQVISEVFKEFNEPPQVVSGGFGGGFGTPLAPTSLPKMQPTSVIQPPVSGRCDVITNAAQDPRFKSFLQVASSTPDDLIPHVVADLVAVQKSFLKGSSSSGENTSHSAHFFSRHLLPSVVPNYTDLCESERAARKDASLARYNAIPFAYVWKCWAFSITLSPKGNLKYVTFWNHNGTLVSKPALSFGQSPTTSLGTPNSAAGDAVASSQSSNKTAADSHSQNPRVTRAIERCDKFAGSMAVLDQNQEAWLFSCPPLMTPIDASSATPGRSIQNRPWLFQVKPVFCASAADFCVPLLSSSSSAMYSEELDAVLHRDGDMCFVMHGNGDWATCHASHIPSSFEETTLPTQKPLDFSLCSSAIDHVGSWDGCGGNIRGISGCAGGGNCSERCFNCGARSHWTCCGSNDQHSKTCSGSITALQAKSNDQIFRLVVRKEAVPCVEIPGLSGGQFVFTPSAPARLTRERLLAMSQQELADSATARAGVQPAAACVEAIKEAGIVSSEFHLWTAENLQSNLEGVKYFRYLADDIPAVIGALLGIKAEADVQVAHCKAPPQHAPRCRTPCFPAHALFAVCRCRQPRTLRCARQTRGERSPAACSLNLRDQTSRH